jgi:DNA repair exonuclease SbcCD nuclease subunit
MARLRFVHAADLHLDSPFRGIRNQAPDNVSETLYRATFNAYQNIIDLCIRERVDALLVAGDIFDGADRSLRAQLKFVEGLRRLEAAGIRSFICHGNHDPLDGWEARLDLPPGCCRFTPEVHGEPVFPGEPERAMVYGISYPQREVRENLVPQFTDITPGGFTIGLLHANVDNNSNHDSYAPCTVEDLVAGAPIDYWALGHVHTRQVLRRERPVVVYPGNPQGRHPNEPGARGVYLVEASESGQVDLQFRTVEVVRWETLEINIGGLETEQEMLDAIDSTVASCREDAEGRPVVFRLVLSGRGALHRSLTRPDFAGDILEQVNGSWAGGQPWLWCDRIQLDTASPVSREQVLRRDDFLGDLARLCDEFREDPEELPGLRQELQELYGHARARQYLREYFPSDDELRGLVAAAEEECLAALVEEEDGP